tara:strand:+ start:738 stop:1022 length:285 start_codon:yes stop_codon:yes gene_type:complete
LVKQENITSNIGAFQWQFICHDSLYKLSLYKRSKTQLKYGVFSWHHPVFGELRQKVIFEIYGFFLSSAKIVLGLYFNREIPWDNLSQKAYKPRS